MRTFVVLPTAATAEALWAGRRVHLAGLPLLVWGLAQFSVVGRRRLRLAGGPPGMSQGMPDRLVTDGIYAYTRNPMYLGHLVFLGGLALTTRSPVALGYLAWSVPWFDARAARDEVRLGDRFGAEYDAYAEAVPRWLPGPGALTRR